MRLEVTITLPLRGRLGFKVYRAIGGSRFGLEGLEFGIWDLGLEVWGVGFGGWGLRFGVMGWEYRVKDFGCRVGFEITVTLPLGCSAGFKV